MIVQNMTDEALLKQLAEDTRIVAEKYIRAKGNKYRRAVLKTNKFPVYFNPTEVKSHNQNTWLLYPFATSRKDADLLNCMYLCKLQTKKETHWYTLGWNKETNQPSGIIAILTHHLILRFNERLKLNKYGTDLLAEYVKHKPENYILNEDGKSFSLRIRDGIILGRIEGKRWIHKTFVALADSTVGNQKKMYELLLYKILNEMASNNENFLKEELDKEKLYTELFVKHGEEMDQYIKGVKRWNKERELIDKQEQVFYQNIIKIEEKGLVNKLPFGLLLNRRRKDNPFIKDFTEEE